MSALVNRVPTGRIISLHAELKYLNWRFKDKTFSLNEMKLDPTLEKTQLDFFPLAINHPEHGRYNGKYDPFLNNPLDEAGFHLTQSTVRDSQKTKAASECFNALEGLGWINRVDLNKGVITPLGREIALMEYDEGKFLDKIRTSILNYGPFFGFINDCINKSNNGVIKRKDVIIGYTNTNEFIEIKGTNLPLSLGSQPDSVKRTRSTLSEWAVTAGYLWPVGAPLPNSENWHTEALKLITSKTWTWSKFKVLVTKSDIYKNPSLKINRPLSYKWMTKSTKALRERGQGGIRSATMNIESKVKNRRFAILYYLSKLSDDKKTGSFEKLITELAKYPDLFIINETDFKRVMKLELEQMSVTSGLIYSLDINNNLIPTVGCDTSILEYGAPEDLITIMKEIYNKIQ